MHTNTESVHNCLKSVIRWSNLRWDAAQVLKIISRDGIFMLTRSDIEKLKRQNPHLDRTRVRGYLGIVMAGDEPQLQLILVSEDRDMDISLSPQRYFDESLVVGTYIAHEPSIDIDKVLTMMREEGRAAMVSRIERWRRAYDVYVMLMAEEERVATAGLVRLFDIPGRDLQTEIGDGCERVLGFFALHEDAAIELIFQGIDPSGKLVPRLAATPPAEDFTTPRPPFDSVQGYGLL